MASPAKRPRYDESIEHDRTSVSPRIAAEAIATNANDADKYIEMLGESCEYMDKFQFLKCKTRFQITNVPEHPEGLLAGIFEQCINRAIDESRQRGMEPDSSGCIIQSPLLNEGDIWIGVRPLNENTVDAILNRFLEVAQSVKARSGVTLWGEPFTVNVLTVNKTALPQRTAERIIGSGSANHRLAPVHHQVKPHCLIRINNKDNNCLFLAMQATMVQAIKRYKSQDFSRYLHSKERFDGRLRQDAIHLKLKVGAQPIDQSKGQGYDAKMWVPKIIDYWNSMNKNIRTGHVFHAFIFQSTGHYKPSFKYGPAHWNTPIILYHDETQQHFHGVQRSGNLFGRPYCLICERCYKSPKTHATDCKARCIKCAKMSNGMQHSCPPFLHFRKYCLGCKKIFYNSECYRRHKSSGFCSQSKECEKCGVVWNVKLNTMNGRSGHVCNEKFCHLCKDYHTKERGCFITPLDPMKYKPVRFIAFDTETMQHECVDVERTKRKHVVNFVAARVACQECISTGAWKQAGGCQVCGPHRKITFGHCHFSETIVDKHVVCENPLREFVLWLLSLPSEYNSYIYSHYGGKFDMVLLFRQLYLQGFNPRMLKRGNKLYQMRIAQPGAGGRRGRCAEMIFRDSWNLLNMKLEQLVSSFGLDIEDKGFFPHLTNRPEFYGVRMPQLPPKEDYLYNGMMPEKKKAFDEWWEQHKMDGFFLDEALPSYCMNDVDILMAALVAFREEFMQVSRRPSEQSEQGANRTSDSLEDGELSDDDDQNVSRSSEDHHGGANRPSGIPHEGIDPLVECMTIASACMRHFRANHLNEHQLAIVPERGYDWSDSQSLQALKYFNYLEETTGIQIQHANKPGGEKRFGNYRVDGWVEAEQRVIEVNGCCWHGCSQCYEDNEMLPTGRTAAKQRERDKQRSERMRQLGATNVDVIWGHEIDKMLEENGEMQECFDNYLDEGPIRIRDGFFGGRTGPTKVYHQAKPGEKISYLDVTSLYPFINSTVSYPVGHPKVHILNEDVCWTRPEDLPYETALLKVFVVPPRKLNIPVLPVKLERDNRLLFPLCVACARKYPDGGVQEQYCCEHDDRQRGWVSTCTSVELYEALAQGYTVTRLYRVLEYEQSSDDLFISYMREFLAQKFHATGFDSSIKGNRELEDQFIRECKERHGIELERAKMHFNKGKRALAKLALNNLWGRFSMRNYGLVLTRIISQPWQLGDMLANRTIEIKDIEPLTNQVILVSYVKKKEWIEEHDTSNVVVSLWTTSCARLLLLKLMQAVDVSAGCSLLYTDTDSIIFAHPEGRNPFEGNNFPSSVHMPPILARALPAGWHPRISPHLGDLTDEFPEHTILEFVSGGAKQYGLKLCKKGAGCGALTTTMEVKEFEHILKIRGITLNYSVLNDQGLRYETFKESVLEYARTGVPPQIPVLYPNFFRPSIPKAMVLSMPMKKIYKPYTAKGIIDPSSYLVLNFGHSL